MPSCPLSREPHAADRDGEHHNDLTGKKFGWRHDNLLCESGVAHAPDNGNRLYLRSRRHLYAHLQISKRISANDGLSAGNPVAERYLYSAL
jgi:hypothetical protein